MGHSIVLAFRKLFQSIAYPKSFITRTLPVPPCSMMNEDP